MPTVQHGGEESFVAVWKQLPFVTRHLTLGAALVFLYMRFSGDRHAVLNVGYFERMPTTRPWTVLTSMLMIHGPDIWSQMLLIVFFWIDTRWMEERATRRSDVVFYFAFMQTLCLILGPFLGIHAFLPVIAGSLTYTRCQANPMGTTNVLMVVPITNIYLPWVNCALGLILGGVHGLIQAFFGIFLGHLYLFLTVLLPMNGGPALTTPRWFRNFGNVKPQPFKAQQKTEGKPLQGGHRLGSAKKQG